MKWYIAFLSVLFLSYNAHAQTTRFHVRLQSVELENLGGLQSYSIATHNDLWLIVGGRLDGLHMKQPFAAFDPSGNNKQMIVVDPETKEVWRSDLTTLPVEVQEQLSSTNMQGYQDGDHLILTGGYGYSPTKGDHITFSYLTVIDVADVIEAIKDGKSLAPHVRFISSEGMAVTGGRLDKIGEVFYLVGGHKFMGRYNPMGPNNGPGFFQEYTNEVRRFKVDLTNLNVEILDAYHDELHLHRRDYNLVPYIEDGKKSLMLYSGVFQQNADLPFLYPVEVGKDGYHPREDFQQKFNHYHCANLPIYFGESDHMQTLFFGGIAQFYMEDDLLVQDNDVPFVKTIASVHRDSDGTMREEVLDAQMPDYLGAGSEFIFSSSSAQYADHILDGDRLEEGENFVGYLYGGIRSSAPNIFWINSGGESNAVSTIFKVFITKTETTATVDEEEEMDLLIYPNPASNKLRIALVLDEPTPINITVYDLAGKVVKVYDLAQKESVAGQNYFNLSGDGISYGAYLYKINVGKKTIVRKVLWAE